MRTLGKYMYVCRNKKETHKKMFMWLSLAGNFIGDFYSPLNIIYQA